VLLKEVTLADTVAICDQEEPFVERSILKPVSLSALSTQLKSILFFARAIKVRLVGAAGAVTVSGGGGGGAVTETDCDLLPVAPALSVTVSTTV
jgi:hypothetical protein